MAASDPTADVPTPTGTLQGVAAFSWDGTTWQPSGRAGPSVATPTGVLRGVAAFNGGPVWQPSSLAQPGVTTPTGTLDGVAVYTWTGDSWAPPGGTATPSMPHGALRGVAAFNFDGTAWQPASQAGPSVATPYGVLDGVAIFGWTGSAWAAAGAPSLSLDFMTPGALDARVTFTRAGTATYFDANGTMQTAATNAPRFDYDPATHALRGLLIEEARTNLTLYSADVSNAAWLTLGSPVVTGNQAIAPDGTMTAARVVLSAVSGGGACVVYQGFTATAAVYTISAYLRGAVGGEQLYLCITGTGPVLSGPLITLSTAWQRYSFITPTLAAVGVTFEIGGDQRAAGQANIPGGIIYVWGMQAELGTFPTSYIPTTSAAVTRAADQCGIASAQMGFYVSPGGSWAAEFINLDNTATNSVLIGQRAAASGVPIPMYLDLSFHLSQWDSVTAQNTANATAVGAVAKGSTTCAIGTGKSCLNGGAVLTTAGYPTGYTALSGAGVGFINPYTPPNSDNTTGYIRRVQYWPRVLSNAEMQSVTT